jgi:uncharacterized protein YecE (DUF72 family)
MQGAYYSGTSNIVLPVPNKLVFPAAYQDKSRLAYYGSLFKGCLLVQLPPGTRFDNYRQLEVLLAEIRLQDPQMLWHIAIEFRHKTWYNDNTYQLLQKYNMTMVTHDMKASATPMIEPWIDFVYLRFHGPEGRYRGSYADEVLAEYASYINEWRENGKTVYAYFNNTLGNALANVVTLNNLVL